MSDALADPDPLDLWLCATGQALLRAQSLRAAIGLERVFGEVAVQVGTFGPPQQFLRHTRLRHHALLAESGAVGDVQCHAEQLALAERSVDLLLLPHTLEFVFDPLMVLREALRVLSGGGHLWIAGMQPWSGWNGYGLLQPRAKMPHQTQVISSRRVMRWLDVLGFTIARVEQFRAESSHLAQSNPLREAFAGLYQIVAVKQTHVLTPIRARRRLVARHGLGSLVSPTTSALTHAGANAKPLVRATTKELA